MEALIWVAIFLMAVSFTLSCVAPRPQRDYRRLKIVFIALLGVAAASCFVLAVVVIPVIALTMMFTVIVVVPGFLWLDRFEPGDEGGDDFQSPDQPSPIDWNEFDRHRDHWGRALPEPVPAGA